MNCVTLFNRSNDVYALIHEETPNGLVTEMCACQVERARDYAELAETVEILGAVPVSDTTVHYLQKARNVSFHGADSLSISQLLPFCSELRNLEFNACELPTHLTVQTRVNLSVKNCQNTSQLITGGVLGLVAYFPLIESLNPSLAKNTATVFLCGASGMNDESYLRRSRIRSEDVEFLSSAKNLFHLGMKDLEFSIDVLSAILRLGMSSLSLANCTTHHEGPFPPIEANSSLTHLEFEMGERGSEHLRLFLDTLTGLCTLDILVSPLERTDLQALSSVRLKLLDVSSCRLEQHDGICCPGIEKVILSSTQLIFHPKLPLSFPNAEIEVIEVW